MISPLGILAALAAACLIPSLFRGAAQDLKEFKFSKTHFDSLWVNAAYVLVVLMYLWILLDGLWLIVAEMMMISIVSSLIFGFIAFRYGGGGDWRALIYIAWIAPFMLFSVLVATGICGIVQAVYWMTRTDIDTDTPALFRKIPFALSILCGYLIALGYFVATSWS